MRKWNRDYSDLREAIRKARIEKVGKTNFEAYMTSKEGSRKIIFVYYKEFDTVFIISGVEGR